MFSVIINYSQQVTEDSWERRFKAVNIDIPELEKELSGFDSLDNPRVVDIQPVNSEDSGTQPTVNQQRAFWQLKAEIAALATDLECNSFDKFNEQMYRELRKRLRQL